METRLPPEKREEMTVSETASLIGHILEEGKTNHYPPDLLKGLCGEENPKYTDRFFRKFYEAIALLRRRGLVMDATVELFNRHDDRIPHNFIFLTADGEKSDFGDEILILDDAQEVVNSFNQEISKPDDVVSQYYLESIRACQNGSYISSAICLGGASERVIDLLAEAISMRYPNKHSIRDRGTAKIVKYLLECNAVHIGEIFNPVTDDKEFRNEIKYQLEKMESIYRLNRNEASHPETVPETKRYEQVCLLISFRKYAKTMFKAIELLSNS